MKRILLINPAFQQGIRAIAQTTVGPPLGLAYIAAVLEREGYDVDILDANALNLDMKEIRDRAGEYAPDFIGFTATTPTVDLVHDAASSVKEVLPGVKALAGGAHVTCLPGETLDRYPAFDYLFLGEAEKTIVDFLKRVDDEDALKEVRGIAFKDSCGDKNITGPAEWIRDLDSVPLPARHLLPMHRYRSPDSRRITTIIAMRGCPAYCIYCNVPGMFGREVRTRSPEAVVEEMLICQKEYGTEFFYFIDDTFTTDREWVLTFCDRLSKETFEKKASWICLTRPDCLDREQLSAMKRAGLIRIELGIESGSEQSLRFLGKGVRKEKITEAFHLAKELGISTLGFVMLNIPVESRERMKETEELIRKTDPDFLQVSFLTPYPGTPYYEHCREKELLKTEHYGDYSFLNSVVAVNPLVGEKEVRKFFRRLNLRFYLHPARAGRLVLMALRHGGNLFALSRASLTGLRFLFRKAV